MIAILNYGSGNLHSVQKAVEFVGGKPALVENPDLLFQADKIILPGVGAFKDGMAGLEERGLEAPLVEAVQKGKPLLGICLGMQLLFDESEEDGSNPGLGLLGGKVLLFKETGIKIPQIGWNQVQYNKESKLFSGIEKGAYFYFNHSYYCKPENPEIIIGWTDYGSPFASAVREGNIYGVQFHPEKSQQLGLEVIKNFVEM